MRVRYCNYYNTSKAWRSRLFKKSKLILIHILPLNRSVPNVFRCIQYNTKYQLMFTGCLVSFIRLCSFSASLASQTERQGSIFSPITGCNVHTYHSSDSFYQNMIRYYPRIRGLPRLCLRFLIKGTGPNRVQNTQPDRMQYLTVTRQNMHSRVRNSELLPLNCNRAV